MNLVLASGSPRRRELLERLGLAFAAETTSVDETRLPAELPAAYVERLAVAKAVALAAPNRLVLGADTTVTMAGRVLGKPGHPEEARSMLRLLSGERHEVLTGVAIAGWDDGVSVHSLVDTTEVEMLPMTDDEIADYVDTGEPMDKAGAYALQGEGGRFVSSIVGSPFTVIGLPIHLLTPLFTKVGVSLDAFRSGR